MQPIAPGRHPPMSPRGGAAPGTHPSAERRTRAEEPSVIHAPRPSVPRRSAAGAAAWAVSGLLVVGVPPAAAQSSDAGGDGLPPILPRAEEVALARSAAPAGISGAATVLVLERGAGFVEVEAGTNGVSCLVNRSWPEALEPHCYDPEASRTILEVHREEAALREAGLTRAEIRTRIAEGFRTGRFRAPSRPAVTWMMSAAQVLHADDGRRVGAWKPHLMIYYPYMTNADLGLVGAPHADGPIVSDEGRPTATMIIVVPSFVEPVRGSSTGGR